MNPPFAVQKIGHAVINVADLEASKRFYTEVLGFKMSDIYPGDDDAGRHGVPALQRRSPLPGADRRRPPAGEAKRTLHHLAFELATLDEVFRARDHLKQHGAKIVFEGRRRAGCQVSVEFLDPDGHHLELYWGVDQIGSDGRARPAEEWRQTATLEDAVRIAPPGQDTTLHDAALRDRIGASTDRP